MRLYTLYDHLAKEAGPVFESVNDAVALRNVRQMMKNGNLEKECYSLMFLGVYDETVPAVMALDKAEEIKEAVDGSTSV